MVDKLDHAASMQANADFWSLHPELKHRQLTMSPEDATYRREWKQCYDAAAKKTPKPPAPRVMPAPNVPLPASEKVGPVVGCPVVAAMTHEQKMEEAIKRSDIWPALKDQVDLPALVATMVATVGGLAIIAATGYGAVAEGIGAGLLVIGGFFAGYQIGGGLMDLFDFFQMTRCDVARTPEDLDAAAKKFSSGVAKTGVGGLFLLLGMKGAKGRTWQGKPIESTSGKPAPVAKLTDAELDAKFGAPQEPQRIKAWEKNPDGSTIRNPTVQEVKSGSPPKLDPAKAKDPGYIWLIDENGKMYVAEEVKVGAEPDGFAQKLGHPTLVEGENARIGGELKPTEDGWVMNNKSGRYSNHADRAPDQLGNAANMMRESGLDVITDFIILK